MRRRLLVERCNEAKLLVVDRVSELLLFYIGLQAESRWSLCRRLQHLRAAHPMQRELTDVLVILQLRDEVQHVVLRDKAERVNPPALGLRGFSTPIDGLELSALE